MPFKFINTDFEELKVINPHVFSDDRGEYIKYYHEETFDLNSIPGGFTEFSEIHAKKNSIRGLHYQLNTPQGKLIHVIKGKIYDVALDIRKKSPTYGKVYCHYLYENDNQVIYIPAGFAHGFLALEDSIFIYESNGKYDPKSSGAILWNDESLNIDWPINNEKLIISEKDKKGMKFIDFEREMLQNG